MRLKLILFVGCIALYLSNTGCAVIPKEKNESLQTIEFNKPECQKVPVHLSFYQELKAGFTSSAYVDPYEKNRGNIKWPGFYIIEEIKKKDLFVLDQPNVNPKYSIEFQVHEFSHSNLIQQTWFWTTFLTIGILPSWGNGGMYIVAVVKDNQGKVINEFKSAQADYHALNGLIFLPFSLPSGKTRAAMEKAIIPKLTNDILNKMADAKLICTQ